MSDEQNHIVNQSTVVVRDGDASKSSTASGLSLSPGESVDGFRVVRLVGRGGMGEVYLARDMQLGRKIALKVILAGSMDSKAVRKDFFREARIMAQFSHPHILTIHGVGEWKDVPYLALEYLEGGTLRQRLEEEALPAQEVLRIAISISEALEEAHKHGVLHRDLKPENVSIPPDGRLRVLDFGLAQSFAQVLDEEELVGGSETVSGADWMRPESVRLLAGTPGYMAPEQWKQEVCTGKTDIWALGVLLFELCTGERPYTGRNALDLGLNVCEEGPAPSVQQFGAVSDELAAWISRCLEKDPTRRPSASEVRGGLQELLEGNRLGYAVEESPFRGLLPFSTRHARVFFGRDAEIAAFMEQIRSRPLLPVVGPSGAGKSSFVRAGIIPRLRERGDWNVVLMRPGTRPMTTLATRLADTLSTGGSLEVTTGREEKSSPRASVEEVRALRDQLMENPGVLGMRLREQAVEGRHVLLVIDQLEEVFTLVDDPVERERFIQAICQAADDSFDPIRVIFTIRDDFLGRLAMGPDIRAALRFITVVQRPGENALRSILEKPVVEQGYQWESPDMVDEMIRSVEAEPACLPLLQFTATRLWDERDKSRKLLLKATYEKLGGVEGALARHADGVLESLTASQQDLARTLLLRMVSPERTRKVISRQAVLESLGDEAGSVLEQLANSRLVSIKKGATEGDSSLELAHESLCHNWKTLARWIDESRHELVFVAEVSQLAELWDRRGRHVDFLLHGDVLLDARRRAERVSGALPSLVTEFLTRSLAHHRSRQGRRRRLAWAGVFLLVCVAIGAVFSAVTISDKEQVVRQERDKAQAQHTAALIEGARAAMAQGEMVAARAKLRTSMEKASSFSPQIRSLWWVLEQDPRVWKHTFSSALERVVFSRDGTKVLSSGVGPMVHWVDVATGERDRVRLEKGSTGFLALSLDDRVLFSTDRVGGIHRWEMDSWRKLPSLMGHGEIVRGLSFHPHKNWMASAGDGGALRVWDLNTGQTVRVFQLEKRGILGITYSPDGKTLAVAGRDRKIHLWDSDTGEVIRVFKGHGNEVGEVAFTPDGKRMVSIAWDSQLRVWDVASGDVLLELDVSTAGGANAFLALSPDGRWVATGARQNRIRVWNVETGEVEREFTGHASELADLAFGPSGRLLVSTGLDRTVRLWDANKGATEHVAFGHVGMTNDVCFSPDGTHLFSSGIDENIRLWSRKTGREVGRFVGHVGRVNSVDVSPDGKTLTSVGADATVRLWDVETQKSRNVLNGHKELIWGVRFRPDGRQLVSSSIDWSVRVWDVIGGQEIRKFKGHQHEVILVDYSPTDPYCVSGGMDGVVRVWNTETGEQVYGFEGHEGPIISVRFHPDGRRVVSAGEDGALRLWDLETGQAKVVGQHPNRIYAVDVSPDGKRIGAPGADGLIRIWNIETGEHQVLAGHRGEVRSLRFSRDGFMASTGLDGTLRVWTEDGHLFWRAPAVLPSPLRAFTHEGWQDADGNAIPHGVSTSVAQTIEKRAQFVAVDSTGVQICIHTRDGMVELWNPTGTEAIAVHHVGDVAQLEAHSEGCVVRTGANVVFFSGAGQPKTLSVQGSVVALGVRGPDVVVATESEVVEMDRHGVVGRTYPGASGIHAVAKLDEGIAFGTVDGFVTVHQGDSAETLSTRMLEGTPSSSVEHIAEGPGETVAVGFATGLVGIWSMADGALLSSVSLHGAINHVRFEEGILVATSELGDRWSWDLRALGDGDCQVMERVWAEVPTVWEDGRPVHRGVPKVHFCRASGGVPQPAQ